MVHFLLIKGKMLEHTTSEKKKNRMVTEGWKHVQTLKAWNASFWTPR